MTQSRAASCRRGKRYALLVAIAAAIFLFDAWRHGAQVVDDAYIALRYSRSLVEGHGLVYNVGERVEGYTSLGFVLFAALCLKLGIEPIAAWKGLSLAAAAAAVVGAARLERAVVRDANARAAEGSRLPALPAPAGVRPAAVAAATAPGARVRLLGVRHARIDGVRRPAGVGPRARTA